MCVKCGISCTCTIPELTVSNISAISIDGSKLPLGSGRTYDSRGIIIGDTKISTRRFRKIK